MGKQSLTIGFMNLSYFSWKLWELSTTKPLFAGAKQVKFRGFPLQTPTAGTSFLWAVVWG